MRARSIVALTILLGCGGDDDSTLDATTDAPIDIGTDAHDTGTDIGFDAVFDAGPTDTPLKGPWSLQPSTDGFTVRWETALRPDTIAVRYQPSEGGLMLEANGDATSRVVEADYGPLMLSDEPDLAGVYFINEVRVTGLEPATCYLYEIVDQPGYEGRACTLHEPNDHTTPIVAYVVGDTNPILGTTAHLFEVQDPQQAEFVIHAGDVQYYESIIESWQAWARLMAPLLEAAPFMPCIGNHEYEIRDEINDYYRPYFDSPSIEPDTNADRYHYASGGVHFFVLNSEIDMGTDSEQIAWFRAAIARAEATPDYRFSIVYFHRPLYGVGEWHPRLEDRAVIEPILNTHNVPLVIAGHMHGYERFEVGAITHITSGGGGGILSSNINENVDALPEDAALRAAAGAFYQSLLLTIEGDYIRGAVMDEMGVVRDSFEKLVP